MFIKAFTTNWYAYSNPNEYGEDFLYLRYDMKHIATIQYHTPTRQDDAHYCDVYFKDGQHKRYFNINEVEFLSVEEMKEFTTKVFNDGG